MPPSTTFSSICLASAAAALTAPAAHADIIVGAGPGGAPMVEVHTGPSTPLSFLAYTPAFQGGVRVAAGDIDGDGRADYITGTGAGAAGHVRAFSGASGLELRSFLPFGAFSGGVHVAAGDLNGDGRDDIITGAGAGGGGGHVKVFDGSTGAEFRTFFAYGVNFTGGVRVAGGDVNGDGQPDIITGAGAGGGGHVKVFDGATGAEIRSIFAFDAPNFTGGVFVASGDIDGDGFADIVTGAGNDDDAAAGPAHVKVFSGQTGALLSSFFAFDGFMGGVRVASADLNGDGFADIITGAGPGGGPHVKVFSGADGSILEDFFSLSPSFTGGIYVAAIPAPGAVALPALALLTLARRRRR